MKDAPDEVFLVRPQCNNIVANLAGKHEVRTIELAKDIGIENIVVEPGKL